MPEQQEKLLERMMSLGLVKNFGTNETTGRWPVIFIRRGAAFLKLFHAVVLTDDSDKSARIMALDLIADGKGALGGFVDE